MFDEQHLVIKDVLNKPLGKLIGVESFADRDAVVNVIVMSENTLRPPL